VDTLKLDLGQVGRILHEDYRQKVNIIGKTLQLSRVLFKIIDRLVEILGLFDLFGRLLLSSGQFFGHLHQISLRHHVLLRLCTNSTVSRGALVHFCRGGGRQDALVGALALVA
jgi:hypothetical protein